MVKVKMIKGFGGIKRGEVCSLVFSGELFSLIKYKNVRYVIPNNLIK